MNATSSVAGTEAQKRSLDFRYVLYSRVVPPKLVASVYHARELRMPLSFLNWTQKEFQVNPSLSLGVIEYSFCFCV